MNSHVLLILLSNLMSSLISSYKIYLFLLFLLRIHRTINWSSDKVSIFYQHILISSMITSTLLDHIMQNVNIYIVNLLISCKSSYYNDLFIRIVSTYNNFRRSLIINICQLTIALDKSNKKEILINFLYDLWSIQ